MPYELRLPPDVQAEIGAYLTDRVTSPEERGEVADAIFTELRKLEVNPLLGIPDYGGPFESRRIYRFRFTIGGTVRDLQVVYKILDADGIVIVAGFSPVPL